jgi:hypothetical protein
MPPASWSLEMRVLTKSACYIEGIWHGANTEIDIPDEHFAESVHTPLEEKPAPEPEDEDDEEEET